MQRSIRILILAGAPLLAFGLWFLALSAALLCYDMCPPESSLATSIAGRIADAAPTVIICAVPMALAWILCLVQLVRARRPGALAALALALPLAAALSLSVFYVSTGGHLLPTTWADNPGWDFAFQCSLVLLLLWPVATFVATFALRDR